jgi:lipoprotein-releasing system ATP-binding protein
MLVDDDRSLRKHLSLLSPSPTEIIAMNRTLSASLSGEQLVSTTGDGGRPLLKARGLRKSYVRSGVVVPVLQGVDLDVPHGRVTALVGRSGSGKSTLLHLLGQLDRPDAGEIWFDGQRVDQASRGVRDRLRNQQIGMIFQSYHLLPELTALENTLAPAMIGRSFWGYLRHRRQLIARATELLERVGLGHRLTHRPCELSGGEMQRTAIARALMSQPVVLLADEPTGNLDAETGLSILQLLQELNQQLQLTIVLVTHDESVAANADQRVQLVEGRICNLSTPRRMAG